MATQAAVNAKKYEAKDNKESSSFTMNIFRGQVQMDQVIPFPKALSQDQSETLQMTISPLEKVFTV